MLSSGIRNKVPTINWGSPNGRLVIPCNGVVLNFNNTAFLSTSSSMQLHPFLTTVHQYLNSSLTSQITLLALESLTSLHSIFTNSQILFIRSPYVQIQIISDQLLSYYHLYFNSEILCGLWNCCTEFDKPVFWDTLIVSFICSSCKGSPVRLFKQNLFLWVKQASCLVKILKRGFGREHERSEPV